MAFVAEDEQVVPTAIVVLICNFDQILQKVESIYDSLWAEVFDTFGQNFSSQSSPWKEALFIDPTGIYDLGFLFHSPTLIQDKRKFLCSSEFCVFVIIRKEHFDLVANLNQVTISVCVQSVFDDFSLGKPFKCLC